MPKAQVEAAQQNKVCCGMTAVALGMLRKGSALGLLEFWTDVGVTLAWRASGDGGWFLAGATILVLALISSGTVLWHLFFRRAGRWADDSKPLRWANSYNPDPNANPSTNQTDAIGISQGQMATYSRVHLDNTGETAWFNFGPVYRHEEFALWSELATGGSYTTYDGAVRVASPLPAGGTWSTPFSYECRDRTSGLYPTYLFLLMSVLGMTRPSCSTRAAASAMKRRRGTRSCAGS